MTLSDSYFLKHDTENYGGNADYDRKAIQRYLTIEAFTKRLTYSSLLTLNKLGVVIKPYLWIKFTLFHATKKDELSRFEYLLFHLFRSFIRFFRYLKKGRILPISNIRGDTNYFFDKMNFFFGCSKKERQLHLAITNQILDSGGIINYLHLDQEETIIRLNERYKNSKKSGVEIFVELLKERYSKSSS